MKIVETNIEGYQLVQRGPEWQIRIRAPYKPGRPVWYMVCCSGEHDKVMKRWRDKFRAE